MKVTCDNKRIVMLFNRQIYIWDLTQITDFSIQKATVSNYKIKYVEPTLTFSIFEKLEESGYNELADKIPTQDTNQTFYYYGQNPPKNEVIKTTKCDDDYVYGFFFI